MRKEKLISILDCIRNIELDGKLSPRKISELNELINYGDFSNILRKRDFNELEFNIPNHKLYDIYNYVVPENERIINSLFLIIPYLLAISIAIYGIGTGNYWLLILLPITFISSGLSSIFGGTIFYFITLSITFYFFYSDNKTLGFITLIALITILFSHFLRIHRRNSLIKIALENEEIFCFLFYSNTLSIYDRENDKLIRTSTNNSI